MDITLAIAIIGCALGVSTFVINRIDKAKENTKKDTKENHQELIEYQLNEIKEDNKEIKNDIKEIRRTITAYKETSREIVKEEINQHVRQYHTKEG